MRARQFRWVIVAVSAGLVAWFAVRRRQELLTALPPALQEQIQERIVLPFASFTGDQPMEPALPENQMQRKVGSNRRISVHGKLYGPLDAEYIGQQVDVLEADETLTVSVDGTTIGTFPLEA